MINTLIKLYFFIIRLFVWRPFIKKTSDPQTEQNAALRSLLEKNSNTVFGKKYGFSAINNYEDFKRSVPVHTYEMLREYIEKQIQAREPYLTESSPIMYAQT
ncbi:MAG TPA: GH3 auxin-responsive promoter family protein, partial [Thermodesulfobacteriota bacterium]|nr:GH3 auxin-responsive promoter family protein [Thermodesulfobacteriota bacterium]